MRAPRARSPSPTFCVIYNKTTLKQLCQWRVAISFQTSPNSIKGRWWPAVTYHWPPRQWRNWVFLLLLLLFCFCFFCFLEGGGGQMGVDLRRGGGERKASQWFVHYHIYCAQSKSQMGGNGRGHGVNGRQGTPIVTPLAHTPTFFLIIIII